MPSPQNLAALQALPDLLDDLARADLSAANTLSLLTHLRKTYAPDLAAAALETAQLRHKAIAKFEQAARMFFTAEALQQATPQPVAEYHAMLLTDFARVADLGCSIGGDALAIGQKTPVLGIDLDPVRLMMAQHNAQIYNARADFLQADLMQTLPFIGIRAAFFDPARRTGERRIFSVADYHPPLSIIRHWDFETLIIKLSPGVDLAELVPFGGAIEFVSLGGELKEALLHIGATDFEGTRATLLPHGLQLTRSTEETPPLASQPLRYLIEPDPAVIRAGTFVELLAALDWDAYLLDAQIAYLTSDTWIDSPWVRVWQIDDWLPFNLKRLKQLLVQRGVGKVTVKKRGSPLTPEALQSKLKLPKADGHAFVTLTRLQGEHIALISYGDQPISVA